MAKEMKLRESANRIVRQNENEMRATMSETSLLRSKGIARIKDAF